MAANYDCQSCGACCSNLPSNRAEGFGFWVEIKPDDKILTRQDLLRKHVTYDPQGMPHLRLAPDGKCLALRGKIGGKVTCGIYHQRPSPCRRVQAGDGSCLRSRQEHGLDPTP